MGRPGISLLLLLIAGGGFACLGEQELRQYCVAADAGCPPCASTADCVIVSNSCHPTATCAPSAVRLTVTQEGCSRGYDPPRATCECVARSCTVLPKR